MDNQTAFLEDSMRLADVSTKNKLIHAAKYEFSKNGFSKTTVESITKRAKVSKGVYYLYFKTKEDVITCMVEEMFKSVMTVLENSLNQIQDRSAKLDLDQFIKDIILNSLKEYYNMKEIVNTVFSSDYELSRELVDYRNRHMQKLQHYLEQILGAAIKKKYIRNVNVPVVSYLMFNMFINLTMDKLNKEGLGKLEYYVDIIQDFLFNGLSRK
jgi:AcrR family transcriptional regulator